MASLSTQGQSTRSTLESLSESEQREIVLSALEANPGWLPPAADRAKLWMALIVGVLVVAVVAIAAGVILAISNQADLSAAA